MTARLTNPATMFPEATRALMTLGQLPASTDLPDDTAELCHLRVSQLNGCAWCLDYGLQHARKTEMAQSRLDQLACWRDSTLYSDAERAALDLAEHMTRFADRPDPVPDPVWAAAAEHHDEKQLAALVLWIATTNLYNRVNVTIRQPPGSW